MWVKNGTLKWFEVHPTSNRCIEIKGRERERQRQRHNWDEYVYKQQVRFYQVTFIKYCLPIYLSICLSTYLSIHPSIHLSIQLLHQLVHQFFWCLHIWCVLNLTQRCFNKMQFSRYVLPPCYVACVTNRVSACGRRMWMRRVDGIIGYLDKPKQNSPQKNNSV